MAPVADYFDLFKLPANYVLDLTELAERYRALLRELHPDRYAGRSEREQRLAVQATADLNHAYDVLRSPLARAQHLLALNGIEDRSDTAMVEDIDLLLEQMDLRERLVGVRDSVDPVATLAALEQTVRTRYAEQQLNFARALETGDLKAAVAMVTAMQFHAKLLRELNDVAEMLDDDCHN
ncbi:MAG: Fe-S protein assembly co-chaperone HscB [Porticoccaceae bacterium]